MCSSAHVIYHRDGRGGAQTWLVEVLELHITSVVRLPAEEEGKRKKSQKKRLLDSASEVGRILVGWKRTSRTLSSHCLGTRGKREKEGTVLGEVLASQGRGVGEVKEKRGRGIFLVRPYRA